MRECKLPLWFILFVLFSCSQKVPENWQSLGIPSQGLVKVYDHTDSNGFYADYKGYTSEDLSQQIGTRLLELGYTEVCSEFAGMVKGFQNHETKFIIKVDELGGKIGLSVFNEHGAEPLLFGLCFKGYKLGKPIRVK